MHRVGFELWHSIFRAKENCMHYVAWSYRATMCGQHKLNSYADGQGIWMKNMDYVEICGNKMPTRCNKCFYCRSYCLLNMFRASLCPSSGAQEYYTVVAACGISCCGFSSRWSGVELRVMRPVCRNKITSNFNMDYVCSGRAYPFLWGMMPHHWVIWSRHFEAS